MPSASEPNSLHPFPNCAIRANPKGKKSMYHSSHAGGAQNCTPLPHWCQLIDMESSSLTKSLHQLGLVDRERNWTICPLISIRSEITNHYKWNFHEMWNFAIAKIVTANSSVFCKLQTYMPPFSETWQFNLPSIFFQLGHDLEKKEIHFF